MMLHILARWGHLHAKNTVIYILLVKDRDLSLQTLVNDWIRTSCSNNSFHNL
jgi:hypothetical protein